MRAALFAAVLSLCLAAPSALAVAQKREPPARRYDTRSTGTVLVDIVGLQSDDGRALVSLFLTEKGFPDRGQHAYQKVAAKIQGRRARVKFPNVPAGDFAVAVLHDENGNFKMDTGLFGIPKEGYGASRDARRTFGPPRFEDARLRLAPGETKRITVRVGY